MTITDVDVLAVATQAAEQHQAGDASWTHNEVTFDLATGGYCGRFVRQAHESALGKGEFVVSWAAASARDMEASLKASGYAVDSPNPGDIICCNDQDFRFGHIVICGPDDTVLENTSSGSRGNPIEPGTKVSPRSAIESEISGYYSPFGQLAKQGYYPGDITVRFGTTDVPGYFTDHAIIGVAAAAKATNLKLNNFMASNRALGLGDGPFTMPAPLPKYGATDPGPMMVLFADKGVPGWMTSGPTGHSIVGVSNLASIVPGWTVEDQIVANRLVIVHM